MSGNKKILLVGKGPLRDEVEILLTERGYGVLSYGSQETFLDEIPWVLDLSPELYPAKRILLLRLDQTLPQETLLLTWCLAHSSRRVTEGLSSTRRVVGFFLLPPLEERGVVELSREDKTREKDLEEASHFFQNLGKETVVVRDAAGGVFGRVLSSIINEAAFALEEDVAEREVIDQAMRLGTNYPYGPLEWADRIGLEHIHAVLTAMAEEDEEKRYRVAPLLRTKVLAGRFGQRVGSGFYSYKTQGE